jgi:hypothetical protein
MPLKIPELKPDNNEWDKFGDLLIVIMGFGTLTQAILFVFFHDLRVCLI